MDTPDFAVVVQKIESLDRLIEEDWRGNSNTTPIFH
jgi:hypothetical protein